MGNTKTDMDNTQIIEQPKWCSYPEANRPLWGCWSLLDGYVKDEDYCKKCDAYKAERK